MILKRLFIGLLILSALTAEGMAFYNTALAPLQDYIASLYNDTGVKDENLASVMEENMYVSSVQYKISAFVPLEEILQSRDNNDNSFCFPYSYLASEPCPSYKLAAMQAEGSGIINISLNGSDISPPNL